MHKPKNDELNIKPIMSLLPHKNPPRLEIQALHCITKIVLVSVSNLRREANVDCEPVLELIHNGVPPLLANEITHLMMKEISLIIGGMYPETKSKRLLEAIIHPATTDIFVSPWDWDCVLMEHFLTSVLPSLTKLKKLKLQLIPSRELDHNTFHFPQALEDVNFTDGCTDNMLVALAKFCPELRSLKLGELPLLTYVGADAITQLQHLEELDITTAAPLVVRSAFHLSRKLRDLRCSNIKATQLNGLARGEFPHLTKVTVEILICDVPLEDCYRALKKLHLQYTKFSPQLLSIVGCHLLELVLEHVEDLDVWTLSEQCSVLENLHLVFCRHNATDFHSTKLFPAFPKLKQVGLDFNRNLCEWCMLRRSTVLEQVTVITFQYPQKQSVCLEQLLVNNRLTSVQMFGAHFRHNIRRKLNGMLSTTVAWQLIKQCPRLAVLRGIQNCNSMKEDVQKEHPNIKLFEECDPEILKFEW